MYLKMTATAIAAGLIGAGAASAAPMDAIGYTLSNGGASLVVTPRLDLPGSARELALSFDGAPTTIDSIALRPNGRRLYGVSQDTDTVYQIDTDTGATTALAALPTDADADTTGFDFNNVLDAARFVTSDDENIVFFPADQAGADNDMASTTQVTDLFYEDGDPNAGADPMVIGNAYTNAVFPPPDSTVQYVIDEGLDVVATLGNNAGNLATVGGLGLDAGEPGGLDILSLMEGSNEAFALLTVGGEQDIYAIDLAAGTASFAADAPTQFGELDGFAVAPVPLPAAAWLLLAGVGGLGALRLRRA